jgi:hypothetical protein
MGGMHVYMISYKYMTRLKQAISVTLDADNLIWLKGRAVAGNIRSVSELIDQLISAARQAGHPGNAQSVVGTIDIDPGDPMLDNADAAMRHLFEASVGRPLMAKETVAVYRGHPKAKKARRG